MQVTIKFKPVIIKGKTKQEVDATIYRIFHMDSMRMNDRYHGRDIRVNYIKVNPKFQQFDKKVRKSGDKPAHTIKQKTKIRDGGWTAYVYTFDPKMIKTKQLTRNFVFVK